jgi:hypothetical protein
VVADGEDKTVGGEEDILANDADSVWWWAEEWKNSGDHFLVQWETKLLLDLSKRWGEVFILFRFVSFLFRFCFIFVSFLFHFRFIFRRRSGKTVATIIWCSGRQNCCWTFPKGGARSSF